MDPFTLLVLVGLATLGAFTIFLLITGVAYVVLFVLLGIFIAATIVVGATGDYLYNKKVAAGKVSFRLPFYLRLKGWQIGHNDGAQFKNGLVFDKKRNQIVSIVRSVDIDPMTTR